MYTRFIRSESGLVVTEVIFVDELIDTVKDQFFKDFRANGEERHWSIIIYYLLELFCTLALCYLFSIHYEKILAKGNFYI